MLLTRTSQTSREFSAWAFPSSWTPHYQNLFIYLNTSGVSRSFLCPVNPRLPDDLWKYQYLWNTMAFQNVCNFASLFVSTEDRKLSVAIAGEQQWGGAAPWISSGSGWRAGGVVALFIWEGTVKKNHCWEKRGEFRDNLQSRCANSGSTYSFHWVLGVL